jgi:hypothetical protein
MSIIDDIKIRQQFDPTGENGGYRCDLNAEKDFGYVTLAEAARTGGELLANKATEEITRINVLFEELPFAQRPAEFRRLAFRLGHGQPKGWVDECLKKAVAHLEKNYFSDEAVDKEGWGG